MPVQSAWKQNIRGLADPMVARVVERVQQQVDGLSRQLEELRTKVNSLPQPVVQTAVSLPKNTISDIAPTVNDDASGGYSVFSLWYDKVTLRLYMCVDTTLGSAVWYQIN